MSDHEVTKFRMLGASTRWGVRVWGAEIDPHDPDGPWSVFHRSDDETQWPVKIEPAASYEDALRIARALVEAYTPKASK